MFKDLKKYFNLRCDNLRNRCDNLRNRCDSLGNKFIELDNNKPSLTQVNENHNIKLRLMFLELYKYEHDPERRLVLAHMTNFVMHDDKMNFVMNHDMMN